MNKHIINFVLGLMCFALTLGIMIQSKSVKESQTTVAKTSSEAEIRDSILRFEEKYNDVYSKLNQSNSKLDKIIEELSKNENGGEDYSEKLKSANILLGFTELQGSGIVITLQDGNTSSSRGLVQNFLVHDKDLVKVVNLLKSGGAEAISINDERIVSTTAITCAGNIIKINGKKVGSPFVIQAIGLSEKLYGTVKVTDDYLESMEYEGVKVNVDKKDKITIGKYEGVYNFNYANNEE